MTNQETASQTKGTKLAEREVKFVPLGDREELTLTFRQVAGYISAKTKQGYTASDADIIKFMMLCKAGELNPWTGDAYLVGYDTQDGPVFNLIVAAQALFKRAEATPAFDGIESGVIVKTEDGIEYREGDLVLDGETLLGGWARCFRKDRAKPFYDALKLATYSTGRSRWKADPAGMIVKCAEASVLRKAFPTHLGGMYVEAEMERTRTIDARAEPKTLDGSKLLGGKLTTGATARPTAMHQESAEVPPAETAPDAPDSPQTAPEPEPEESPAQAAEAPHASSVGFDSVRRAVREALKSNDGPDTEAAVAARRSQLTSEIAVLAFDLVRAGAADEPLARHIEAIEAAGRRDSFRKAVLAMIDEQDEMTPDEFAVVSEYAEETERLRFGNPQQDTEGEEVKQL